MLPKCCTGYQCRQDDDLNGVRTDRQLLGVLRCEHNLGQTVGDCASETTVGNIPGSVEYDIFDFLDLVHRIRFALEADFDFKDCLLTGGDPCGTEDFHFSDARLVEAIPITGRQRIILEPLQMHGLEDRVRPLEIQRPLPIQKCPFSSNHFLTLA